MITVNAMGDACPIPVVKTKNAIRELGEAGGVVETLVTAAGLSTWKDGVVFAILIVVLLLKPTGILGKQITEKV